MFDAEVLIVGGGPAGSSLAFALARKGVDVLIADRARFPRGKPCAEYLSPQASRILDDMGALRRVEQSGAAALAGVRVRAPNGAVIAGDFVAAHGYRGYRDRGLSVRREVLDAILLDCARMAGARVMEGARVTDVVRDAGPGGPGERVCGVRVLSDTGRAALRARFVVGADGLRSVVASRLGLARRVRRPRRLALVTRYRDVAGMGEQAEMHGETDGYIGIADVGGGITTVSLVVPASRASELARDRTTFLESWIARRPHLAPRFAAAQRVAAVRATGPFASRARHAWAPGAALVGDAADFFDPFTGEGIYAALRGGELLAAALLEARSARSTRAADAALASYERARRREFGGKWIVERAIAAAVGSPALINRAARNLASRKDLADLLIGVTGNFVPPHEIITAGYLWNVFIGTPQ
ncbi:MAG TPA: NAD(P)/FAD-dependent oxidoreductase [Gemmatimonadaceae bacterium]|nr:NAD(P)/FAD-dependent oxidoreductase [Gemmatimonadaceae bacterium]